MCKKRKMDLRNNQQSHHKPFLSCCWQQTQHSEGRGGVSFITENLILNDTVDMAVTKHLGRRCSQRSDLLASRSACAGTNEFGEQEKLCSGFQ